MFKKITRKRSRYKYKYEESTIKPNVDLAINDIADYQNIIKKEQDSGYKGLKNAFTDKSVVKLVVRKDDGDNEEIMGTISHYDDNFSQLVIITGNSLKRLTFNQIEDVHLLNGGTPNEELPD
jgi:hypothetical protein